jgi:Flp pilus assembly protein TadG
MIMATFELAMVFLISVTLDSATAAAARTLRTGQTVADGVSDTTGQSAFQSAICANMGFMQSITQCQSNLYVDVRTMSGGFQNQSPPDEIADINSGNYNNISAGPNKSTHCFYSGNAGDVVLVRAYFTWTLLTPFLNKALSRLSNGQAVISSTTTFMNEPFVNAPQNVTGQC